MLTIRGLAKTFETGSGRVGAVRDLDLHVEAGEFFVLLGHSGCGKTTLLRAIAGLERPDGGEIELDGRIVSAPAQRVFVEPEHRGIAMVFQSYAIWPHMTVYENVAFPLVESGKNRPPAAEVRNRVRRVLEMVNLGSVERSSAATLSGGQQQRVALARALVREPKLLLMDEPLSNLDAKLRERMRIEIKALTSELGLTTIHVTHDQTEAMAMADRMAVMSDGVMVELGPPESLYAKPATKFVADFLGQTNWIAGTVVSKDAVDSEIGLLRCDIPPELPPGTPVDIGLRPEAFVVTREPRGLPNEHEGFVQTRMFLGDATILRVRVASVDLIVRTVELGHETGEVYLTASADRILLYPAGPSAPSFETMRLESDPTAPDVAKRRPPQSVES